MERAAEALWHGACRSVLVVDERPVGGAGELIVQAHLDRALIAWQGYCQAGGGCAQLAGVVALTGGRVRANGDPPVVSAQLSPGSMKTKSSCEKGRNLGQPRVDAQVDGCLMTL
jgi:hypothetical protein